MASRRKDFVNVINNVLQKNANDYTAKYYKADTTEGSVGEPVLDTSAPLVLAEDMSNMVDVGKLIANLSADDLKAFALDVAMGIAKIEYIDRELETETYGIIKNSENYNGAYERLAINSLPKAVESSARSLISGKSYFDGKYYGADIDARVFSSEHDFKIPYSISYDDVRAKFVDAKWVETTLEQWRVAIKASIDEKLQKLADNILNANIFASATDGRIVHLVTSFNTYLGLTGVDVVTWADIKADDELRHKFAEFVELNIKLIRGNMKKRTKKYNDGSILMHTPSSRLTSVFLTEFVTLMNDFGRNIYHNEGLGINAQYETIGWQTCGDDLVPTMNNGITSTIVNGTVNFGAPSTETDADIIALWKGLAQTIPKVTSGNNVNTLENIVGIMYDDDMCGGGIQFHKVGVENVGAELFNTYHEHYGCRSYLDTRGNAIVFALD